MLDANSSNACATELPPKAGTAPLLPIEMFAYDGITLLPPIVHRREVGLTCGVRGCGKTMPWEPMQLNKKI